MSLLVDYYFVFNGKPKRFRKQTLNDADSFTVIHSFTFTRPSMLHAVFGELFTFSFASCFVLLGPRLIDEA